MCVIDQAPTIETPRLSLRAPQRADAIRVATLCDDVDIPRMTTRMPWPYKLSDAQTFIAMVAEQNTSRENTFLIDLPGDGVVGCIGVFTKGPIPEVGYWIGRPYWGRGYATEALKGLLSWVKSDWRRRVLIAGHFADNPASGAVLIKAGFLYTGDIEQRPSLARGEDAPTRMMVWVA